MKNEKEIENKDYIMNTEKMIAQKFLELSEHTYFADDLDIIRNVSKVMTELGFSKNQIRFIVNQEDFLGDLFDELQGVGL